MSTEALDESFDGKNLFYLFLINGTLFPNHLINMLIGVREDAFHSNCWSARNIISLAAGKKVEVLPLYVHSTADMLSQKLLMCLKVNSPLNILQH